MRYLKAAGMGMLAFLFLNGIQAVSENKAEAVDTMSNRIVYVEAADKSEDLKGKLDKLQTIASIREVLEVNFRNATLDEKRDLAETIFKACTLFDLDVELVLAVIQVESSFNTNALSNKGAMGLMQVMPRTGWAMSEEMSLEGFEDHHLFDFRRNVMLGSYYLKKLINRYDRLDYALTAYNAGPTNFDNAISQNRMLPQDYANKVQGNMKRIAMTHFNPITDSRN